MQRPGPMGNTVKPVQDGPENRNQPASLSGMKRKCRVEKRESAELGGLGSSKQAKSIRIVESERAKGDPWRPSLRGLPSYHECYVSKYGFSF